MSGQHNGKMSMFYLYTRYERFWHWLQAALIVCLLVTGFEVHGSFTLLGFKRAVTVHAWVGVAWLIAFAFFVFWVATTGEWKQYVPTTKKMFEVMRFYAYGIFMGWPHPCPKTPDAKHNPLQRLTYLALAANAFGLGGCWAGYFNAAASSSTPLIQALALPEHMHCLGAMMIGYPKFAYHRLPTREPASITWRL